jgi:hypothetical protein
VGGKEKYELVPSCIGPNCSGNASGVLWGRHEMRVPCIILASLALADEDRIRRLVGGCPEIDPFRALSCRGTRIVVWCVDRAMGTGGEHCHDAPASTSTSSATTCNSPSSAPVSTMGWKSGFMGFRVIRT